MKKPIKTLALSAVLIFSLQGCGNSSGKSNNNNSNSPIQTLNTDAPVIKVDIPKSRVVEGESLLLDASNSYDTNGKIIDYIWKDKDGKILASGPKLDRLFTKAGTYTIVLEVIDDQGVISQKEITINVERNFVQPTSTANKAPVAKAEAYVTRIINGVETHIDVADTPVKSSETIHFKDDGSYDPDGDIVKYEWRDMDGILLSSSKEFDRKLYYFPEYDFNHDGTTCYKKTLYVTDNDGAVSSYAIDLCVHQLDNPVAPSVVIKAIPGTLIKAGQTVTLDAVVDDPDGVVLPEYSDTRKGYTWKDEDGNVIANTKIITLDNLPLGQHTFYVTVEDNDGLTTTVSITINVTLTGASGS